MENQTIPDSGDPRVDAALARIRGRFQDLEDAMVVQAHLEKRAGERIKEHAEAVASHEQWLKDHSEAILKFDTKMLEIEDKVNWLIDNQMRREGGPETRHR